MSNFKALQQVRRNELGIQMIPSYLRNILFGDLIYKNSSNQSPIDKSKLERVKAHLHKHNLWNKPNRHAPRKTARHPGQSNSRNTNEASSNEQDGPKFKIPDMEPTFFKMPSLCGANVEEHFDVIGRRYSKPYADLATAALNHELSVIPTSWKLAAGWHKYTVDDNGRTVLCEPVPYPNETFLVFDVEVCMNDSNGRLPTLAVAAGPKHWYLWCSDRLVSGSSVSSLRAQLPSNSDSEPAKLFTPNARSLIPFGIQTETARLIVGHNVSFDRSYISEQYNLKQDALRFLDTMSLHISISGLTGYQRALCFSYRSAVKHGATDSDIKNKFERAGHPDPSAWADSGSLNSLAEVYQFYCNQKLDKADRDLFVTGSLDDVRADFQTAASYCARDVRATWQVMARLWPQFQQRFPHSVTLAGMLEMSAMYLPINLSNWNRYLQQAQQTYDDLQSEQSASLVQIANDSCKMIRSDRYRKDVWFWDLDWSTQSLRYRKSSAKMEESLSEVILETKPGKKPKSNDAKLSHLLPLRESTLFTQEDPFDSNSDALLNKKSSFMKTFPFVHKLLTAGRNLKKVQPLLAGYPHWYREFCDHPFGASKQKKMSVMEEWLPGPFLISTQMRAVPKLLRLTWNGHILHYDSKEGWGFLVPTDQLLNQTPNQILLDDFPIKEYLRIYRQLQSRPDQPKVPTAQELLSLNELESEIQEFGSVNGNDIRLERRTPRSVRENGELVGIPMFGCYFYRLPHKDGPDNRVGNPLGKEFVRHMESGALRAFGNRNATQVLKISKTLSYWKMANKRIASQMICQCDTGDSAALLPRVIVAGLYISAVDHFAHVQ